MEKVDVICRSHLPDLTRNPAWLEERKKGVTATEAARLLAGGSWMDLWARKTGRIVEDDADYGERAYWGLMLEEKVLEGYSSPRYANRPVERVGALHRSREYPWLMATLDAMTEHPDHGWIPLDAKTTDKHMEWKWEDGVPEVYLWQIRVQAVVQATTASSIACLLGGNRLIWTDDGLADDDVQSILAVTERFHWHVQNDVPPSVTDHLPETRKALNATFMPDPSTRVELPSSFVELDLEYAAVLRKIEELSEPLAPLQQRKEEIENQFRRAMCNAGEAVLSNGSVLWKQTRVKGSTYTVNRNPYNRISRKVFV